MHMYSNAKIQLVSKEQTTISQHILYYYHMVMGAAVSQHVNIDYVQYGKVQQYAALVY